MVMVGADLFRHRHFSADNPQLWNLLPPGAFIARVCKDQFCTFLAQCTCDSLSEDSEAVCCSYSIMVMILCSVPFSLSLDNQSSLVSKYLTELQAWRFNSSKTESLYLRDYAHSDNEVCIFEGASSTVPTLSGSRSD